MPNECKGSVVERVGDLGPRVLPGSAGVATMGVAEVCAWFVPLYMKKRTRMGGFPERMN